MRACWAATLLVLVQPSPASCATCTSTSALPRVLALTHRHLHKSPCVRQPSAEISGSISFSSLCFLSRKLCPILCVTSRVHSTIGTNPSDERSSQQCCESCEVKVLVPPIACSRADSISDACKGNDDLHFICLEFPLNACANFPPTGFTPFLKSPWSAKRGSPNGE